MGQPPVRLERILAPFNGNKKPAAIPDKRAPGLNWCAAYWVASSFRYMTSSASCIRRDLTSISYAVKLNRRRVSKTACFCSLVISPPFPPRRSLGNDAVCTDNPIRLWDRFLPSRSVAAPSSLRRNLDNNTFSLFRLRFFFLADRIRVNCADLIF